MRLDKYLTSVGLGTRSTVKKILKQKRVKVFEQIVTDGKFQLDETTAKVTVDDELLSYQKNHYYMLNKPKGYVSATKDPTEKTVLDLLDVPEKKQLFPVGRLDKDTTGLLLITDDGELSHTLLSPRHHVSKTYTALIAGVVTEKTCATFSEPMLLKNGEQTKPSKLIVKEADQNTKRSKIKITITEGKYHQIKRMFGAVGMKVLELKRIQMGPLELDYSLKKGQYRPLTETELAKLHHETL